MVHPGHHDSEPLPRIAQEVRLNRRLELILKPADTSLSLHSSPRVSTPDAAYSAAATRASMSSILMAFVA
jgi:hypothetical protein